MADPGRRLQNLGPLIRMMRQQRRPLWHIRPRIPTPPPAAGVYAGRHRWTPRHR